MTTLTPETALERLVVHTAMEDAAVAMECEAALKPLLAALSTERQARESTQFLLADRSTELDWERSARQAAEKEVERLDKAFKRSSVDWLQMVQDRDEALAASHRKWRSAEAKFAALVEATAPFVNWAHDNVQCDLSNVDFGIWSGNRCEGERIKDWFGPSDFYRLTIAADVPPPVPTEEGEPQWSREFMKNLALELLRDRVGPSEAERLFREFPVRMEMEISRTANAVQRAKDRDADTAPTQAQDVAGLVERLTKERDIMVDLHQRLMPLAQMREFTADTFVEWMKLTKEAGEQLFALAGRPSILLDALADHKAALRPSPISHETKALVLAAADNNHKALVEALTKIARAPTGPHHCEGLGGVDPDCARASETVEIAKAALAAFQSRQEGKAS